MGKILGKQRRRLGVKPRKLMKPMIKVCITTRSFKKTDFFFYGAVLQLGYNLRKPQIHWIKK